MIVESDGAATWFAMAEEARTRAAGLKDPMARRGMDLVVSTYDRLARTTVVLDAGRRSLLGGTTSS